MTDKTKIQWWVPMSYHAQQAKREIVQVFSPVVIARIIFIVVTIFAIAAYLLPKNIPGFEFDWGSAFIECMFFLIFILVLCSAIAFIPPILTVTHKGILVTQGQTSRLYPYAALVDIHIEDNTIGSMLVFRLRSQKEAKQYLIAPKIACDELWTLIDSNIKNKPK